MFSNKIHVRRRQLNLVAEGNEGRESKIFQSERFSDLKVKTDEKAYLRAVGQTLAVAPKRKWIWTNAWLFSPKIHSVLIQTLPDVNVDFFFFI